MDRFQAPSRPLSSYEEALAFLESALNYERTRTWSYNTRWFKLSRMERLLAELGDPHRRCRIIHVAGTKGKGSTAGAVAHALSATGQRAGLLTSPHLVTARERACVDGEPIGEEEFLRIVRRMQPYVAERRRAGGAGEHKAPTYFEMMTALAFEHFARRGVDWAAVEVGLGGRLDSTNVVCPAVCVVTAIALDHTDKLGESPAAIAGEKAGIIKDGVPLVIGRQPYPEALEVLRRAARQRGCPCYEVGGEVAVSRREPLCAPPGSDGPVGWRFALRTPGQSYDGLTTPLIGAHQLDNLAAALGAVEMAAVHAGLERDPARVAASLAGFTMPARIEVLRRDPTFVLDVAHTVESVRALLDALELHLPGRALHVVFGCSADKNVAAMLGALRGRCASLTASQAHLPRALPAGELARRAEELGWPAPVPAVDDPAEAVQEALAEAAPDEIVCATGSFFMAGEVRAALRP